MFYVIGLGISMDCPVSAEEYYCGKIQRLPSHLYDSRNEKNYWLGVCMLLMQLDSQAMDSLFMGPGKHDDILQCIINTMSDSRGDGDKASDPFWPALQCFMVILDRLGSKTWSHIEPDTAFHAVTSAGSYVHEIQNIRQKTTGTRVKLEQEGNCDDMVSCSQMVYDSYSVEQGNEWSGWLSDNSGGSTSVVFEEMSCLVNILQSEVGQNMRVYGSTFLWFLPFVRSVMELAELGIVGIVIDYLYYQINKDIQCGRAHTCEKVTEFFVRVLVDIIELHLSKDCMGFLCFSTHKWVPVVVQVATLSNDWKCGSNRVTSTTSRASVPGVGAMSQTCMNLIRALLKKGRQMGTDPDVGRFLDLLIVHLREVPPRGWSLTESERDHLQNCLVKLVKAVGDRSAASAFLSTLPTTSAVPPVIPHLDSTSPHCPQQSLYKDAQTGTKDLFNLVKEEPAWAEHEAFCDGLDDIGAKKEPRSPLLISEFKVELKPDFGKIQEIRSRLNDSQNFSKMQAIAMRKSDSEWRLNGCSNEKDAGCGLENHAATSQLEAPGSSKLGKLSKNNWNEDSDEGGPLNVHRRCQKKSVTVLSSDSDDVCDSQDMVQPSGSTKEDADSYIIVISDDEVDMTDKMLMGGNVPSHRVLNDSPERDYNDLSESQVFEFETQQYVASYWDNSSFEGPVVTKKRKHGPTSEVSTSDVVEPMFVCSNGNLPVPDEDIAKVCQQVEEEINETQPVTDEDIEKVCQQVEEQISKRQQLLQPFAPNTLLPAKPRGSPENQDHFIQPKPVISQSPTKKPVMADKKDKQCRNKKTLLIEPLSQKPNRRSHTASALELEKPLSPTAPSFAPPTAPSTSSCVPSVACQFSTPAIVPPKKVRKCIEPESVVERLGLKKKERKAFDLSQRSLDCLGELRSYGQNVHVEPQPKSKRIRRAKKAPQNLPGKSKKLLESQEMQYYRESRRKCQRSKPSSTVLPKPAERHVSDALSKPKSKHASTKDLQLGVGDEEEEEEEENDYAFLPCSQPDPDQVTDSKKLAKQVKISMPSELNKSRSKQIDSSACEQSGSLQNSKDADGGASLTAEGAERANQQGGFADDDDEWRYLTQNEPTDMEICSQMEMYGEEDDFCTQSDPVDMDIDADEPDTTWAPPKTLSTAVSEKALSTAPAQNSLNDHLFLKPGLPPITPKKTKPSTTKIYASVSRSASLAVEMEKASKPLPAAGVAKAKVKFAHAIQSVPPLPAPVKVTPTPQPPTKQLIPSSRSTLNQAVHTLPSKPTLPQVTKAISQSPFLHPLNYMPKSMHLPPKNMPQTSQPRSYNTYSRPEAPVSMPAVTVNQTQNLDQSYLTQAVLKWEHHLFDNYKTFGAPEDLHSLPLKKVPMTFSSYEDYFNILFPLLLLNAFEEMASEWHSGSRVELNLQVQGIEYSNRIASAGFTASLNTQQEKKQLYPKEEDLVFLWLPENTGAYASVEPEFHEPLPYLGFVSRSMVYSNRGGEPSTLNLTVQTRGNVSSVNSQPVRCQVIGSLVSTMREFRALCLLRHSVMRKALLTPHLASFTHCQEGPSNLVTPPIIEDDYNKEQQKAIGCGVAMVKRSHKQPKILLIHGPPGTGKSKTIVGLLDQLLFHNQGQSCRTRILVCTPSNAAIDNLMKKMIPVFKMKSTNPQGNCGNINLVRLGNEKTISSALHAFSLDSQTKAKTRKGQQTSDSEIQRQKEELDQCIENISQQCAKTVRKSPMFQQLMKQKTDYLKEREKLCRQLKENRSKRQEVQTRLLQDANVICSTLSTSGSSVLEWAYRRLGREPFSCVIIDEAGQAKETETLIPFLHRCPSLILVGDPEQLPPTVVSQKAKELGYDQSLMVRVMRSLRQSHPCKVTSVFLSMQYRMHPDICEFPSKYVYNKTLKTDSKVAQYRFSLDWPFVPYRVFDVMDGSESRDRDSFCNLKEVQLVVLLVQLIMEKQVKEKQVRKVGVITPYNAQKLRLREALKDLLPSNRCPLVRVEVDTVDGFQGRDMDCIIVSCVRASSENGSIGFVGNRQRMNVTITRAKFSLFILGHLRTLREQRDWGALIDDAAKRGTIIKTRERDFSKDMRKILKCNQLHRSLSYPPTDVPGTASPQHPAHSSPQHPAHSSATPAHIPHARRPSEPLSRHSPRVSSSTGVPSRLISPPPPNTNAPRDPRLAHRPSNPHLTEVQPIGEPDRERWRLQDSRQPVREPDRERRGLSDPRQQADREARPHDNDPRGHCTYSARSHRR
ncbi:putative helicase senataxin isoform X2 [Brachyhypopomus gauderio]